MDSPVGVVVAGTYEHCVVFVIKDSIYFKNPSTNSYNSIDKADIISVELKSQGKKDASLYLDVIATAFFGIFAGALTHLAQQGGTMYSVQVELTDKRTTLIECNKEGYDAIQRIYYSGLNTKKTDSLSEKKPKDQSDASSNAPSKDTVVQIPVNINPDNVEPTITRIELFLESGEWEKVKAYSNAALDYFPTDPRLYLFLLCEEYKITKIDRLKKLSTPFNNSINYKMAYRFGDETVKKMLDEASDVIDQNRKDEKKEKQYREAKQLIKKGLYNNAKAKLLQLKDYKDSSQLAIDCDNRKEEEQKKRINKYAVLLDEQEKQSDAYARKYDLAMRDVQKEKDLIENLYEQLTQIDNTCANLSNEIHELGLFGNGDKKKLLKDQIRDLKSKKPDLSKDIESHNRQLLEKKEKLSSISVFHSYATNSELQLLRKVGLLQSNEKYKYSESNRDRSWILIGRKGSCLLFLCNTISAYWCLNSWKGSEYDEEDIDLFSKDIRAIMVTPETVLHDGIKDRPDKVLHLLLEKDIDEFLATNNDRRYILYGGHPKDGYMPATWYLGDIISNGCKKKIVNRKGDVVIIDAVNPAEKKKAEMHGYLEAFWVDLKKIVELV